MNYVIVYMLWSLFSFTVVGGFVAPTFDR